MLPAIPLLVVMLAPWIKDLIETRSLWARVSALCILIVSFIVQVSGAVVGWGYAFLFWVQNGLDPYTPDAVWDFRFQVIPIHLKGMTNPTLWDIAWIRTLAVDTQAVIIPIISVVLLLGSLAVFTFLKSPHKYYSVPIGISLIMIATGVITPMYPSVKLLKKDPHFSSETITEIIRSASERVQKGDLVLVDSYGTRLWYQMLNSWTEPVPWYSLPYEIPGSESVGTVVGGQPARATLQLVEDLVTDFNRILYLTSSESPDYALQRELGWLDSQFNKLEQVQFNGEVFSMLVIYSPSEQEE